MISELENVSYELDPLRIKYSLPFAHVMLHSSPTDWFRVAIHLQFISPWIPPWRKIQATLQDAKAALLRDSQSWANNSPWVICAHFFHFHFQNAWKKITVSVTYLSTKITLWNSSHGLLLHAWCSQLCLVRTGKQNLWHRLFWLNDQQQSCFLNNALFSPLVVPCFLWYTFIKNLASLANYEIKRKDQNQQQQKTPLQTTVFYR